MGALEEIFSIACAHDVFPRNRFGLVAEKSVVSSLGSTGIKPDPITHEPVGPVAEGSRVTTALRSENQATCEVVGMMSRGDLGADWLRVVVDRSEVENLDVSRTAVTLSRVLVDRNTVEQYRGRVDMAFFRLLQRPTRTIRHPGGAALLF